MESAAGRADEFAEPSLFARKATAWSEGWAVRDAFIYAFFSINLVTLGLHLHLCGLHPGRQPVLGGPPVRRLPAVAGGHLRLVAAMPRAGGDYIWISRTLGGGIGFARGVRLVVHPLALGPDLRQHPQRRGDRRWRRSSAGTAESRSSPRTRGCSGHRSSPRSSPRSSSRSGPDLRPSRSSASTAGCSGSHSCSSCSWSTRRPTSSRRSTRRSRRGRREGGDLYGATLKEGGLARARPTASATSARSAGSSC